jgi:hypothetical protein
MLDVHPPHEAVHTWKDFFIHIATIVIGLLIAVGLEQTVEWLHHRHQLHRLEEALDQEIDYNQQIIARDLALVDRVVHAEEANKASLEQATRPGSHTLIVYTPSQLIQSDAHIRWGAPVGSVGASARDSGTLSLLPVLRASYLSRLDLVYANTADLQHQIFDQEYRVQTYAQLRSNINDLTPQEREDLLLAVSQYLQVAEHTRYVLERTRAVLEQAH